jgi:hypothetical protein
MSGDTWDQERTSYWFLSATAGSTVEKISVSPSVL